MNVVATRVAARNMANSSSAGFSSPVYSTGKIVQPEPEDCDADAKIEQPRDIAWYTYDTSVMEGIMSGKAKYDVNAGRVRREDEDAATAGATTAAEILHFAVEQERLIAVSEGQRAKVGEIVGGG
jgi:hypothetical protein